jgi:hypothetical protein
MLREGGKTNPIQPHDFISHHLSPRPPDSFGVTPSPTQAPTNAPITPSPTTLPPGFSFIGIGFCRDSSGNQYDAAVLQNQASDLTAASAWCKSATAYTSSLVGFELVSGGQHWFCLYDKNTTDTMQITDFSPGATFIGKSDYGSGTVTTSNNNPGSICYKNEVRPIHSNCMISFLIFSNTFPDSLIFRIL